MLLVIRLATWAIISSVVIVFCLTPILVIRLELAPLIYHRGQITELTALLNLSVLLPLLVGLGFLSNRRGHCFVYKRQTATTYALMLIIGSWLILYTAFGGLDYRIDDVNFGYDSRSRVLQLLFSVQNVVLICLTAVLIEGEKYGYWRRCGYTLALIFMIIVGASGSRGILIQLIVLIWLARYLDKSLIGPSASSPLQQVAQVRGGLTQDKRRLVKLRTILFGILGISIFVYWQSFRDQELSYLAASLNRIAEPYWFFALVQHSQVGNDISVLGDALSRIGSILGRWIGIEYDYSINGSEKILREKLDIVERQGVSLPITYIGEGMLMRGVLGAILFQSLTYVFVIISFSICYLARHIRPSLWISLVAFQIVKCFFLYPKSLSGVFLVLFYETGRDIIALVILSVTLSVIPKFAGLRYSR